VLAEDGILFLHKNSTCHKHSTKITRNISKGLLVAGIDFRFTIAVQIKNSSQRS